MNNSSDIDQLKTEIEELSLLLDNRTFVDYFNTFLCLPVFGQHVFYNYMENEFDFEPPLRNRRHLYLDRREILKWLCTERLRLFKKSALFTEYKLCMLLRDTAVDLPGIELTGGRGTSKFTRNVIGTTTGMLLFRESMRGTNGELVYRCWKDIEAWRLIEDPIKKMYWKHVINFQYISQNSSTEVAGKTRVKVFNGVLNFDLVHEDDIHQHILNTVTHHVSHSFVASDEALLMLQAVLLQALRKYWLPRHLLHIPTTLNKDALDILLKPAPGDEEYLDHERRLRCHFMFPTIYQNSSINSPATSVFVSKSAGELPKTSPMTSSFSLFDDDDYSSDEEEENIDPVDLFSLWGGPAKEIQVEHRSSTGSETLPEAKSPEILSSRKLRSANISAATRLRSPIPIVLTSYLGGKKRTLLGNLPKTIHRVIWSLASDTLASCPFRAFLERNGQYFDLHYLSFWTDVRNYLDTDEHVLDGFGQPLRRSLANKIARIYLSTEEDGLGIFSKRLKMSLLTAINTNNDLSLVCMAQNIIEDSLWEPLKLYIHDERHRFMEQVSGLRYQLDIKQRRAMDQIARASKSKSASNVAEVDPMYFFNCAIVDANSASPATPPVFSSTIPCTSSMSRPGTSYHVCITEEQMWKAMELTVLCCEYGVSMMLPQYPPRPEQLVDVLHSDYGSLHVTRFPAVRHEWLRSLTEKPKINIETIKVSRTVILDKVDIESLKSACKGKEAEPVRLKTRSRLSRRDIMIPDTVTKPKSLVEALSSPFQFDYFKRFMLANKMGMPLMFWKAVEDLKDLNNVKTRQTRVTQIIRKFFGKYGKYGAALDCHEEVIRQIQNMERVTPGILICAQAAVFRSLERKWFSQYIETFPESDGSMPNTLSYSIQLGLIKNFEEAADFVQVTKKVKKKATSNRKTMMLWKKLTRALVEFCQAVSEKSESQLFEMYLKYEVEREKNSMQRDQMTNQMQHIEKNIMMSNFATNVQTRVVVRNRLIIMNRLPSDMRFWIEVQKYQELVDMASQNSSLGTEFLCDKARSIIACYLASEIMPKVQINIPNDMAAIMINSLVTNGAKRGLFHDAIVLIFPILFHFYRKFSEDWMKGNIPDEYFATIDHVLKYRVATSPHNQEVMPDFKQIQPDQFKTATNTSLEEGMMKIQFSLSEGVVLIYPHTKLNQQKSGIGQVRRMTKHSLHAVNEELPRKESGVGHGDKKDKDARRLKSDDKQNKHNNSRRHSTRAKKASEKIVVKEADHVSPKPPQGKRQSVEKARRLSILVESLNKEKETKIKEQNNKFSKLMAFGEIVSAAMAGISEESNSYVS